MYREHPHRAIARAARHVLEQLSAIVDVRWIVLRTNVHLVTLDERRNDAADQSAERGTGGKVGVIATLPRCKVPTAAIARHVAEKRAEIQTADHRYRSSVEARWLD